MLGYAHQGVLASQPPLINRGPPRPRAPAVSEPFVRPAVATGRSGVYQPERAVKQAGGARRCGGVTVRLVIAVWAVR